MKNLISGIASTLLTTVVYFLGGLDTALITLLIFIVLDYITGLCKAIVNKKVNSLIGAKGIVKKSRLSNHCSRISKTRSNSWRYRNYKKFGYLLFCCQ